MTGKRIYHEAFGYGIVIRQLGTECECDFDQRVCSCWVSADELRVTGW